LFFEPKKRRMPLSACLDTIARPSRKSQYVVEEKTKGNYILCFRVIQGVGTPIPFGSPGRS